MPILNNTLTAFAAAATFALVSPALAQNATTADLSFKLAEGESVSYEHVVNYSVNFEAPQLESGQETSINTTHTFTFTVLERSESEFKVKLHHDSLKVVMETADESMTIDSADDDSDKADDLRRIMASEPVFTVSAAGQITDIDGLNDIVYLEEDQVFSNYASEQGLEDRFEVFFRGRKGESSAKVGDTWAEVADEDDEATDLGPFGKLETTDNVTFVSMDDKVAVLSAVTDLGLQDGTGQVPGAEFDNMQITNMTRWDTEAGTLAAAAGLGSFSLSAEPAPGFALKVEYKAVSITTRLK